MIKVCSVFLFVGILFMFVLILLDLLQPLFPGDSAVDQLVDIIKVKFIPL